MAVCAAEIVSLVSITPGPAAITPIPLLAKELFATARPVKDRTPLPALAKVHLSMELVPRWLPSKYPPALPTNVLLLTVTLPPKLKMLQKLSFKSVQFLTTKVAALPLPMVANTSGNVSALTRVRFSTVSVPELTVNTLSSAAVLSMVIRPPPSTVVSTSMVSPLTKSEMVTAEGPQSNVTSPPPTRASPSADSVQLAGEPVPTTPAASADRVWQTVIINRAHQHSARRALGELALMA